MTDQSNHFNNVKSGSLNSLALSDSADLRVEYLVVSEVRPLERNPRTHSKKQIEQIAASIQEFEFTNPVLIDEWNPLIAGHGRLEAAQLLKITQVPCIRLIGLSDEKKRALVLADNKIALNSGWDLEILADELEFLSDSAVEFDVSVTGFETPEIDLIIGSDAKTHVTDEVPAPDLSNPSVSQPGDLWILGRHRLFCGSALEESSFRILMGEDHASMVFTDPPYNVPINGHVCGSGSITHREFEMASGEMTPEAFTRFLNNVMAFLARHSEDGSLHYLCMDWRHIRELLDAAEGVYSKLINLCVWNKSNGGMGSFYRSKHELVFVFRNGTGTHINNVELGKHGRNRTNVWDYPSVNGGDMERRSELALHPTVKPVAMVADAILDCTHRDDIVLDAFIGSGTTLLAAEQTGRRCYGMEIDPAYVDVAIRRYQDQTGSKAILAGDGRAFNKVRLDRSANSGQSAEPLETNEQETSDGK